MHYVDVLFPINLGPLTYRCPESLAELIQPGLIIQAPLKNKLIKGIILGKSLSLPDEPLKELQIIPEEHTVLSKSILKLITWMSEYYLSSEGLVLKQTLPREIFGKIPKRKTKKDISCTHAIEFLNIDSKDILQVTMAVNNNKYKGFLLHAPSVLYEYSMVLNLLSSVKNVIVLLPDINQTNLLYASLKNHFAERICLLHGELRRGKRSESVEGICSGKYDIVIGTRSALFAPLKKVSLIIVLNEHNQAYKVEEGIRFHMRDVAVMRGFMEKAVVLLSSISPSIDSYFNTITGKYSIIEPAADMRRPVIRIADMRFEKKIKQDFSKTVYDTAKKHIQKNNKILFTLNRRGYSTMLLCRECSHIIKCRECDIPMVLHKQDHVLKCHYCSKIQPVPEICPRCKSHHFELLGTGTQQVQEQVEELFRIETIRFDSDKAQKRSEKERLSRIISDDFIKVLIGTKMMTRRLMVTDKVSLAVVMSIDNSLNLPDFRALEKAYQYLSAIVDLVMSDGEVLIQTRFSRSPLFRYLRLNDYNGFVKEELLLRKSLGYPPYVKLVNISFRDTAEVSLKMMEIIRDSDPSIEVLGPATNKNKKGIDEFSIILKSVNRNALNTAVRKVLKAFKHVKKVQITIDVDPL